LKSTISLIAIVIVFASCQKQPTANFNTDKSIYYAGETVHLTDASTNAHHWQWTMPNGTTNINSKNADYTIPADDLGGIETFNLKVTSRYNSLNSSISKSVTVSQPILGSDFVIYSPLSTSINLEEKYSISSANYWRVRVGNHGNHYSSFVDIYFSTKPISTQVYTLQSNFNSLAQNEACINWNYDDGLEVQFHKYSKYGSINIGVNGNGKISVNFNSIKIMYLDDTTRYSYLNGNITCH
jgi:PKD repeat protein